MHLKCGIRATTMHVTSGAVCVCSGTVYIACGAVGGQLVTGENRMQDITGRWFKMINRITN